ncbi:phosphatidate cytidylyltransferase [Gangjinia marincola]|uniref:Phosphatidate cytidylyltransferase n=1 Tax=Gangjinia marincola TaxID=578463 RepID=A0ABP3XV48_9FLAO
MNEAITRGVSGLLYIAILIGAIFISKEVFAVVIVLFGVLCIHEFQPLIKFKNFSPYIALIIFVIVFGYLIPHQQTVIGAFSGFVIFVNIALFIELVEKERIRKDRLVKKYAFSILYLAGSITFLTLIPVISEAYLPYSILGIFILIWTNDTFAYVVGKNFGRRKLFERISPKKTVEGFVGGVAFSILAGLLLFYFTQLFNAFIWIGLAMVVSIFGTLGDLIQSRFKRQANVKDSGTLMPGHGGMFDRLDSIIYASPFIYLYLKIVL